MTALLADLEREQAQAQAVAEQLAKERRLVEGLEVIRGNLAEHWDSARTANEYATAFREYGLDLERMDPQEAGARIAGRPAAVEIAAALDEWTRARRETPGPGGEASWRRLVTAARAADPDPWRNALRDQIGRNDRAALRRLAEDKGLANQPAPSLVLLASALRDLRDLEQALVVLRAGWREHPDDFWINFDLGNNTGRFGLKLFEEAVGHNRTAVALRPRSSAAHNNLGAALYEQGKLEEAIAEVRTAIRLKPDDSMAHNNLGNALDDQGKVDEAIAEFRTAIRLEPDLAIAHANLGIALAKQGKRDEAITEFRTAIRLKPDLDWAHYKLGVALGKQGKREEGIAELRIALRLKPDLAEVHTDLGAALHDQGKLNAAIAECRTAIRLKPDLAEAHANLGDALGHQGKRDEAIAELHTAIRLKPDFAAAHTKLGNALRHQGKRDEAIAELHTAIQLEPDYPDAHTNLGNALRDQGKVDEAITEYRTAIRLKPDYTTAHSNLGLFLREQGKLEEAIAEFRKARDLARANPSLGPRIERFLDATERMVKLDKRLSAVLTGQAKPSDPAEAAALAELCYFKKLHVASARLWDDAFKAQPDLANDMQAQNRYSAACVAALAGSGQGKDVPPLEAGARARWRQQALDWLKADLAAWSKIVASGPPPGGQGVGVVETLRHWQDDRDLAGLRDEPALKRLPQEEQKAYRALWAEVDGLLKKVAEKPAR